MDNDNKGEAKIFYKKYPLTNNNNNNLSSDFGHFNFGFPKNFVIKILYTILSEFKFFNVKIK